jgi:hypothetical protein
MPDGERRYKDADGNSTAYKNDGRVFRMSNSGIHTVTRPDGSVVQKNQDGSLVVTDSQGNTRAGVPGEDDVEWPSHD